MKKLQGWLLIILCSLLLIAFAITFFTVTYNIIFEDGDLLISKREQLTTLFGFVAFSYILILGLKRGIRLTRQEKKRILLPYNKELKIEFSGKINYKDYRNTLLFLTFKKPRFILILFIIPLFISSLYFYKQSDLIKIETIIPLLIIGFTILPILTILNTKKTYKNTKILQQELEYKLNNETIHIKGDTIDSTLKWNHFIKIEETKKFYLLYNSKIIATFIDKDMFSKKDLKEFDNFLKSIDL
ncbi:YcxB family protein [Tenacibaculum finnmarkense]|uniref:YcxB family protein n=1 Tax=Tenacibaculum finnmarkense TaxID=2781243 RepID=UPI001E6235EB|nr:YcxB family protein [Tenacibaculum finnmarkense]MCD8445642.1 YcxB family protein [Tenacibaculum finnmarkense genomovar ulcerans]